MDNKEYLKKILSAGIHIADKAKLEESLNELPPSSDNKPHQYLTTNEKGEKIWEDKICYTYLTDYEVYPETVVPVGKKVFFPSKGIIEPIIENETYIVTWDNIEYICQATEDTTFGIIIGNKYLGNKDQPELDNKLPFLFVGFYGYDLSKVVMASDNLGHTFSIRGSKTEYTIINGAHIGGGVYRGKGPNSTIIGGVTGIADGTNATSFGNGMAYADFSIAEGFGTTHPGASYSHAEGSFTDTFGSYSHVEGFGNNAYADCSHVQGRYSISDTEKKYAHIVGNGSSSEHKNAHTLDWHGNAWYAGTIEGTGIILKSSTENSEKRFLIKVDDSGALTATEIVE